MYGREYLIEMEVREFRKAMDKARAKALAELSQDALDRVRAQDASDNVLNQDLVGRFESARRAQERHIYAQPLPLSPLARLFSYG